MVNDEETASKWLNQEADKLTQEIALAAITGERERCAAIVKAQHNLRHTMPQLMNINGPDWNAVLEKIAKEIENG